MRDIRIAAAQFEHRDGDKAYNLQRIDQLTARAVACGAEVVSFHEGSITAYSYLQSATRDELMEVAEEIPGGPSCEAVREISARHGVPVLAGLVERDGDDIYNTYVCMTAEGLVARFRKLHAFLNPHLSSGSEYCVFDLLGCRVGLLICYDNNLVENVRITALMGAEIIFMPHVTGCLPSVMPGRGLVDPDLWTNRHADPVSLRQELDGPKGRDWLMKWLPARAYENGVYAIFTNPIGMDGGQVRNGHAMVLDPFGEVIAECRRLEDDVTVGLCTSEKIGVSSGQRYLRARRPDLYGKLVEPPAVPPETSPGWERESPQDG
ncbi:MAG: nitrilase family protein [Planctomycetota bacterium]|nr:nitrilase family protein [Planctomycetota bacterium]